MVQCALKTSILTLEEELVNDSSISRRVFVGAALSSSALAPRKLRGDANGRISIGLIGAGGRGQYNLREIQKCTGANAAVTAICDVYRPNRERAVEFASKAWGSAAPDCRPS